MKLFNEIYSINIVLLHRGRTIRIGSSPEIRVEVDGKALGLSPFEFEMLDRAIHVVVSEKLLREYIARRSC